jgi:hypothetical protein
LGPTFAFQLPFLTSTVGKFTAARSPTFLSTRNAANPPGNPPQLTEQISSLKILQRWPNEAKTQQSLKERPITTPISTLAFFIGPKANQVTTVACGEGSRGFSP